MVNITRAHVRAINDELQALISKPIYSISVKAMKHYEKEYYRQKCSGSKALIDEAVDYIPGGVQHNLAFNYPFPLVFTKAEGAFLTDVDGNEYLDFLQAGGPTILGSNPPEVRDLVADFLKDCGPSTGLFHEYELKLAKLVSELLPSVYWLRMFNSGSEAASAAIRVARLATSKKHVLKMGGAYHGWSDQLAYGIRVPGSRFTQAHGVPSAVFKYTDEFFPGDLEDLENKLESKKRRGGTAAVLIEPVGPESGTRPIDEDFLRGVQYLCRKYDALLVFDEVVTGFRLSPHGAQGLFNIDPDLTILGKALTGGYPSAGGLGGKPEFLKFLSPGISGGAKHKKALVGGTLAANPLSAFAGYHSLKLIAESDACEKANQMGDLLTSGLQALIAKRNLPFVAFNQGSICHLETVGTMLYHIDIKKPWTIPGVLKATASRKREMEYMGAAYMAEGIVTLAGSRLYTSAAFDEALINRALASFDSVFQHVERID